jgi:hypothetical protein
VPCTHLLCLQDASEHFHGKIKCQLLLGAQVVAQLAHRFVRLPNSQGEGTAGWFDFMLHLHCWGCLIRRFTFLSTYPHAQLTTEDGHVNVQSLNI